MTPKLAVFLKDYKAEREAMYWQLGKPLTLDDLVFTSVNNAPIGPAGLSREFRMTVNKCGLGKVRFHDLRHTFASLMLLKGVNPKVISEALGHSSVGFTLDVYSHIIGNMQSNAMALLNDVLPEGKNKGFKSFNASLTPQNNITQSKK
jgi:integrase